MKAIVAMAVLAVGSIGRAQTPAYATAHAPDGGTVTRIQSIIILPLTGAPFSAIVDTEATRILADGTTATVRNRRSVARDSSGRVFQERRYLTATGDTQPSQITALEYSDPNSHEFFSCIPAQKTCYASQYWRPAITKMPTDADGLKACMCGSAQGAGVSITHEALGQKTIESLDATGSREITTLPAGQFGNEKPQPVVKEFWYSPRLGLNLITKRFDPRSGTENFVVSHLSLDEPNPETFGPPSDYKVVRQVVEKQATAQGDR